MEGLQACFQAMFTDSLYKIVLSKCRDKADGVKKVEAVPFQGGFQLTRYEGTQVFHQNVPSAQAMELCRAYLQAHFLQANAWDGSYEYILMVSKAGKISFVRKENKAPIPVARMAHDRKKNYILEEGIAVQPLIDMGVLTLSGQVVKAKYDKFRQINRFLEFIDDVVKESERPLRIIDFGCGKSYLTFVLYYYFTFIRKMEVYITGLDLKADVIENCNRIARKYGYDRLQFEVGDIGAYHPKGQLDMVVSLHACDTATDFALYNAVAWNAKYIFSVPCCQHELSAQMESAPPGLLTRYGIARERFAALLTDSIRANLLEHCGYRTQLLEFVDLAHTPKNLLIRAVSSGHGQNEDSPALREVLSVMQEYHVQPTLYNLLFGQLKGDKYE